MRPVLEKLHNDHINFIKVLTFLEDQVQLLKECKHADIETILDAIRYMKEYPDFIHHPLENTIFHYCLDHFDEAQHELNALLAEHDALPALTDKLIEMLQAVLANEPQEREKLYQFIHEYVCIQKEHMNREEVPVYPTIDFLMSDKDWENVSCELAHAHDPMFGERVKQCYQELFQRVVN